jgi:carboxypeptidase C (cathepsin A)
MLNYLHADSSPEYRELLGLKPTVGEDIDGYEPCEDDYSTSYLNQDSVKVALHVKSDIEWEECSYAIKYNMKDRHSDMTSNYNYLIDGGYGLNILVYSGDDDSVCSTEGTQSWIWDLGYRTGRGENYWATQSLNDQTVGYLTKWTDTKMAFLTIRNAGHEVPTYQPEVAYDMFAKYLNGFYTDA